MNKQLNQDLSKYRLNLNLKLKDIAYLLEMDEANLSRFEAGKSQNPKAFLSYNLLFNLSNPLSTENFVKTTNQNIIHRCFKLLEILETKSRTVKNRLRKKGVNKLLERLIKEQENHEKK